VIEPPPPLLPGGGSLEGEEELRFPGHLRGSQHVEVGLGGDGSASGVDVTQRLTIDGTGDFAFTVPAPLLRVDPTRDSQSRPGQRNSGIVWQGFSPGRRVLGARASLEPTAAGHGLPLAVRIERRGDTSVVRLTDVTRRHVRVAGGSVPEARLRPILRRVLAGLGAGNRVDLSRTLQVVGSPTGARTLVVDLPLRVRGTVTPPGKAPVRVSALLGGGRPLTRTIAVAGGRPRISLRVEPLGPRELLPAPAALARSKEPLRLVEVALARVALANQYAQYLASPDPLGVNRTDYVYRTVAAVPVPSAGEAEDDGGTDTPAIVLAAVLGSAALLGLAVLWARS
jgi:hypothetical protein